MMGSEARFRNMTTRCRTPASSKFRRKNSASVVLDAHGGKDDGKLLPSSPATWAWRTIWAASSLWAMPEPEKMGSFCPRIRVVSAVDGGDAGVDTVSGVLRGSPG